MSFSGFKSNAFSTSLHLLEGRTREGELRREGISALGERESLPRDARRTWAGELGSEEENTRKHRLKIFFSCSWLEMCIWDLLRLIHMRLRTYIINHTTGLYYYCYIH